MSLDMADDDTFITSAAVGRCSPPRPPPKKKLKAEKWKAAEGERDAQRKAEAHRRAQFLYGDEEKNKTFIADHFDTANATELPPQHQQASSSSSAAPPPGYQPPPKSKAKITTAGKQRAVHSSHPLLA